MVNPDEKQRVVVVDMPDAGQAAVVLARAGISRTDPDYFRGIVTNAVLTGYSGRLNQEIRIKRGLSYGAAIEWRRDGRLGHSSLRPRPRTLGRRGSIAAVVEIGRCPMNR